ncbi:hypothetical protein ABIB37_001056 [Agrococcus sp. UYP10]|uniref:hypothetical protein n=1 Tax=Agrococcus sp. UYP10 TaxID=1756355 RepID=UPI0033977F62
MSDPHVLGPDLAPTPFTADEIRAGNPDGRRLLVRTRLEGRTTYHCDSFQDGDADGCALSQVVTDASGTPVDDPRTSRVTWRELQAHAAFPEAATTVTHERIRLAVGEVDCLRYDVQRDDGASTFWFAVDRPGMPLRYASRGAEVEVVEIA